jgi:hypothetical protein
MANLIIRMGTLHYLEELTLVNWHFNVHMNTLGWNKNNNEHEVHQTIFLGLKGALHWCCLIIETQKLYNQFFGASKSRPF